MQGGVRDRPSRLGVADGLGGRLPAATPNAVGDIRGQRQHQRAARGSDPASRASRVTIAVAAAAPCTRSVMSSSSGSSRSRSGVASWLRYGGCLVQRPEQVTAEEEQLGRADAAPWQRVVVRPGRELHGLRRELGGLRVPGPGVGAAAAASSAAATPESGCGPAASEKLANRSRPAAAPASRWYRRWRRPGGSDSTAAAPISGWAGASAGLPSR